MSLVFTAGVSGGEASSRVLKRLMKPVSSWRSDKFFVTHNLAEEWKRGRDSCHFIFVERAS